MEKATTLAFSHESSVLQKSRGPDYVSPGWGVNTTGDGYTEIHSLYKGTAVEPSKPGIWTQVWAPRPALDGGRGRLGRAAAGAGCALRAANAVGCAAVL